METECLWFPAIHICWPHNVEDQRNHCSKWLQQKQNPAKCSRPRRHDELLSIVFVLQAAQRQKDSNTIADNVMRLPN